MSYPGYTFESPDINKKNSRIDYIFASDSLIGPQSKIDLIDQTECDTNHNSLLLNTHTLPRTPPEWKFNDDLLKSDSFCQNLSQNIQSALYSFSPNKSSTSPSLCDLDKEFPSDISNFDLIIIYKIVEISLN